MDKRELQIIEQLMEELKGQMEMGAEDYDHRLGREKPAVEVVKMEGSLPMDDDDELEEPEMEADSDESPMMADIMPDEDMSPDEKLKQRILKMRGE